MLFFNSIFIEFSNDYFSFSSFLKNGIRKIIQATRKKILPNIAQKLPMLDIINPIADIINKIHPTKLILLLLNDLLRPVLLDILLVSLFNKLAINHPIIIIIKALIGPPKEPVISL